MGLAHTRKDVIEAAALEAILVELGEGAFQDPPPGGLARQELHVERLKE